MIRCPQCAWVMNEVATQANPGQLIVLDQCSKCGGVWCDKWELFPVDAGEAEKIDPLDKELLKDRTELTNRQLYCPRCTAELHVFADPILPKDIQLQHCRRCDGVWLNRGQFRRYKSYQKQTRARKLGAETIIAKLPAVYQNPKAWVVTGTKGIYACPRGEAEPEDVVRKSIGAVAKLIFQYLLRLVIGI
ncbi:MAG TPA: zf-TFIIB domain-containing protein [Acidobacteriota bacterium]|nr:zf-TFIIB domain-containing protein [Acidobacteriota bacterium]